MPLRAKFYIALILAAGTTGLIGQFFQLAAPPTSFWFFLAITVLCSGLKVPLPTVTVTLSVNFLLILVAIAQYRLPEAMAIAAAGAIVQVLWQAKVRRFIQVAFTRVRSASRLLRLTPFFTARSTGFWETRISSYWR